MAGVAFAVEGDGVCFETESYAASALYTTLASLSGALWRIRRVKALVAHRGALGAGIVADIVLRPPVEVDIDDAAIGFMRSSALQGSRKTPNIQASSRVIWGIPAYIRTS